MLTQWAVKHGIPATALDDLKRLVGIDEAEVVLPSIVKTEADVMALARIEASRAGARLFRNNVGAAYTDNGDFIRYGLANDSAKLNVVIKSSDLIGIRPVLITPNFVGHTIGQFIARECKAPGWTFAGTERERAQLRFIELVISLGGDAKFICGGFSK